MKFKKLKKVHIILIIIFCLLILLGAWFYFTKYNRDFICDNCKEYKGVCRLLWRSSEELHYCGDEKCIRECEELKKKNGGSDMTDIELGNPLDSLRNTCWAKCMHF